MPGRVVDWNAVHGRLASTTGAISGGLERDPEQVRRTLEARGRTAAMPPVPPDDVERIEVLAFSLAGETYGVETRHVGEVCQLKALTVVPCTPSFVAGVVNLRGRIVAIVDLRRLFELPARGLTELDQVIVLAGGESEMGLLADSVDDVSWVPTAELRGGPPTLTGIRERFLKGVTGQMLAVLDGGRLLGDAALKVNEQVAR